MENISPFIDSFLRWIHIIAGVLWIGHLYFFNFVNIPFVATMDGDTKKKVIPELAPRALFWFRYGALWTWVSGVLLLALVFYHSWETMVTSTGGPIGIAGALFFLVGVFIYDILAKMIADKKVFFIVALAGVTGYVFFLSQIAHFEYRAMVIHVGALFGSIMAFNVWFRIWPAQQKIITGVKTGTPAEASIPALAALRSRHNTYMSVPLIWMMINAHTTAFNYSSHWYITPAIVLAGWLAVICLYRKSSEVKGF